MSTLYSSNFDSATVGALPSGWQAVGGTWTVQALNPVSGANAFGSSAVNATEQTVADENTAPTGVTFSAPSTEGASLAIGDIPAGQHKAFWIKRIITAGAAAYNSDSATLTVKCDTAA